MQGCKLHGRLQTGNAGKGGGVRNGRSEVMEMSELPCGTPCVEQRSPDTFVTCIVSRCLCAYVRHTREGIPDTALCTLRVSDYMISSTVSQSPLLLSY